MTAFEMPTAKTQSAAPVKPVDMAAIARAATILEAGGLVAMPTETSTAWLLMRIRRRP